MSSATLNVTQRKDLRPGERLALISIMHNVPGAYSTYSLAREMGVAYTTALRWVDALKAKGEIRAMHGRLYTPAAVEG